jgi:hypothetical protein
MRYDRRVGGCATGAVARDRLRWEELMNPVETLAYLQAVVDRMLGKSPRISDRQVMIAVLRTLADREERRAGLSDDDDGPPPMPVTRTA